jgi:hypothetical protein
MHLYQPLARRSPIRRHQGAARRILRALVLIFPVALVAASPVLAQGKKKGGSQSKGGGYGQGLQLWTDLVGPFEVDLVFTDSGGKQKNVSLVDLPPDQVKMLPPLLQAEAKLPLVQPKVWYFEGLWFLNSAAICKEAAASVQHDLPAGNVHEAYNVNGQFNIPLSCRPFKVAYTSAVIDSNAPSYFVKYNSSGAEVIPPGGYPTNKVRQVSIQMGTPANMVPFYSTTPCTSHSSNITSNQDPRFTDFFEVTFTVVANSTQQTSWQFGATPMMKIEYYAGQTVLGGQKDYTKEVSDLESSLEKQAAADFATLAATGELSWPAVVVQFFADLFKYGIGGLYSATCNADLYNEVSSGLAGPFNSPTLISMAKTAEQAFKTLFVALGSGDQAGFSKLDIEEGPHHNLVFKLTYPAPDKPVVQTAANADIHLDSPALSTGGAQVEPGVAFPVRGDHFLMQPTTGLVITWTKTVVGPAIATELQWGPKGGKMQSVKDPSLASGKFLAPTLQPNTSYQFRVHECDAFSCAPWSELTTSTKKSGADNLGITLDNDTAHPVATVAIPPSGSFVVNVTLPAGTSPGKHTLHADPLASVDIVVAGKGGAAATISVIDTRTDAAMPAPINLLYPNTISVRGNHFAPSASVTLYLDSLKGPKLGTATADKTGLFVGKFQIPMTTTGKHQLVAVQVAGGKTLQATEEVMLASQPK